MIARMRVVSYSGRMVIACARPCKADMRRRVPRGGAGAVHSGAHLDAVRLARECEPHHHEAVAHVKAKRMEAARFRREPEEMGTACVEEIVKATEKAADK